MTDDEARLQPRSAGDEPTSPLPPEEHAFREAAQAPSAGQRAVAAGVVVGALLYTTAVLLLKSYDGTFFSIPFFVGLVVGLASPERAYRNTLLTILLTVVLAVLTLREGVICVLFGLPIVTPLGLLGALSGRTLRRGVQARRHRQGIAVSAVLLAIAWQAVAGAVDDPRRHPRHHAEASVEIAAADADVFAALTARPLHLHGSWPWFIEIGLPVPKRLEVLQPRPGGALRLTESTGVAHGHVTDWQPPRGFSFTIDRYVTADLPFRITRLGRSPDYGFRPERVEDWLTFDSLSYRITPLADGRARLMLSMDWRRHLAPDLYFGWLQAAVIERGQQRLLTLVRESIERQRAPERRSGIIERRLASRR